MKKILFCLVMILSIANAPSVYANENADSVKTETNKWVGIGQGIGEAVNSTLNAIEDHVIKVSNSSLGKTAIFIVVWKLLAKDFIRIIIGSILIIFGFFYVKKLMNFLKVNWKQLGGHDDSAKAVVFMGCVLIVLIFWVGLELLMI